MADYKQLCAELVEIWDNTSDFDYNDFGNAAKDLVIRARAALAEAEPEGPSAEEVEELCEEHCFNVEGYESIECLQGLINESIARWGRPAPVTAEGELVELVTILRGTARCLESHSYPHTAAFITRAAALLRQLSTAHPERLRHCPTHGQQPATAWGCPECVRELREQLNSSTPTPMPVALSECPWEREGWCDDEGRCWAFNEGLPAWEFLSCTASRKWADLFLPFDALPLPAEEVE